MDVPGPTPGPAVVVLLHGKNFCGTYCEYIAMNLSAAYFRIIIPDQVRFGKSSKPVHVQFSFQQLANLTYKLLDSLKITSGTVIGHSMGGMLATRFALMYPGVTKRLVLVNPIGLEDWKLKVPYQTVDDWYRNELKQDYQAMKKY